MRGDIPSFPNTSSWRGALQQQRHSCHIYRHRYYMTVHIDKNGCSYDCSRSAVQEITVMLWNTGVYDCLQ